MDSATLARAFDGYKELVNNAMDESHEIADALGFLAQAVDDMEHNGREWRVNALVLYQHPDLTGEVADALKTILAKVPAEAHP